MKINLTPARIKKLRPKPGEYTVWDANTPHLGVRVAPTGSMRFTHLMLVRGKLKRTTIGDPWRMTLDRARSIARDLNEGRGKSTKPCPTFAEWVEVWWEQTTPSLKPSTRRNYRNTLDRHLMPTFGNRRLDAIGRTAILKWFTRYSRKAPGNANKAIDLLGNILNHAIKAKVAPGNPVRSIRKNPKRTITRCLSGEERDRLLAEIDAVKPRYRTQALVVRMLVFTGCRLGEILHLRWDEVGDNTLDLADSKTGTRKVWLGSESKGVLAEARARQEEAGLRTAFVFPSTRDHSRGFESIDPFWYGLRARAGIPDVRLHDLRHSFASDAVRKGIPLPVVAKLLGHSDIKMTMRYTHAGRDEVEESAERIGKRINTLLCGSNN